MFCKALSAGERSDLGRTTTLYIEIADRIRLERQMICDAKRARAREVREEAIRETDLKRLLATQEEATEEVMRKRIAEAAASFTSKRHST